MCVHCFRLTAIAPLEDYSIDITFRLTGNQKICVTCFIELVTLLQ